MTIWKFPIKITDVQKVEMPMGAEILSAQMQNGDLCLWALVSPANNKELRTIEIHGTGNYVEPADRKFIGTAQMAGGALVWHVFESI